MRAATRQGIAASATATGPTPVADACAEVVAELGAPPGLVLAFVSGEMDFDSQARAMQDAAGDGVPTAGFSGTGLIGADGPIDQGCVAVAFSERVTASVARAGDAGADLRAAGRAAAASALDGLDGDPGIVLLFIDLTTGDLADAVAGAYEAVGPTVPLAGGAAGGDVKSFFHMGEHSSDSIVAIAISSEGTIAIGDTQSSESKGDPSIVTRSDGLKVEEIDGRPAEEVYLERIGFAGVAMADGDFQTLSLTHPLAQPELHGNVRLRHVTGRTGDGAILVGTHIPASAAIEFTELDFEQLLRSGGKSVRDAATRLGDEATPEAMLVFDCVGRRKALRDGLDQEVEAIASALDDAPPLAGLYTCGEVARIRGAKGDRNHAVITVAFG